MSKGQRAASSRIGYRPTWAEVSLDNLAHNFARIKSLLGDGIKVMPTVKADAYGHGLIPVSRKLVSCGADFLGVASIDEGIALRKAKISLPVLILGMILKNDIGPLFKYDLIPTVCDEELARALNLKAAGSMRPIKIHIKVDTGMGRIGVLHRNAAQMVRNIHKMRFINIEGIFTHFAFADMDEDFTSYQIDLFNRLVRQLSKDGIHIPLAHAANSMGIIGYGNSHFNMVRPGLVIYGLHPKENLKLNLRPVLRLKSRVVFVKRVSGGFGVSYGHEYVTKKPTTLATLPIGYGDGYPRNLSNQAPVLIAGRRYRIAGRVCMDQIVVDVKNSRVKVGAEAVLIGSQGKNKITAEELAGLSGTIPYEIVCGLGSRIPRVYV